MDKAINEAISDLPAGFKMTELGPLPEEWEVVRLGEVASIDETKGNLPTQSDIPFIPMSFIPNDGLYITNWELRKPEEIRSGVIVRNGNLLLAKITPCLENGKQGIVKDLPGNWGYATTEVFPICPSESIVLEFLAFYLKESKVRELLVSKMEGATGRQRLPKSVLMGLVVPLPPLPEQRAIAHVLRTVQRAKETTERVIQATRELKKSLMRHLFTYGPVSIYEAENVPLKETEISLVPEYWEVVRLGEVAMTATGGTPSRKHPEYFGGNIPWVKSGELNDNLISYTEETITDAGLSSSNAKIFPKGTLLIAMYGATAGKVGILEREAATNQAICAVFPQKCLFSRYLFYTFIYRRTELLSERYGGAQPNISQTVIKNFNIPVPPLSEQHKIAYILEAIDKKLQAEEARKQVLETLFKTFLHHLMTGKVRVKDLVLPETKEAV